MSELGETRAAERAEEDFFAAIRRETAAQREALGGPIPVELDVERAWGVPSASDPGRVHIVAELRIGDFTCSCPCRGRYECRHIKAVRALDSFAY